MLKLLIIVICIFVRVQIFAQEDSTTKSYKQRFFQGGTILFPEVADWCRLDTIPKLSQKRLLALYPYLNVAIDRYIKRSYDEDKWLFQLLVDTHYNFPQSFYEVHANGDTHADIVFTGNVPGKEYNGTVIWYGTENGYEIKQSHMLAYLSIAIERTVTNAKQEGKAFNLFGVSTACCLDMTETFILDNPIESSDFRRIESNILTNFPAQRINDENFIVDREGAHLRISPEIDEVYDSTLSSIADMAVIGNTIAVYIAGASGRIVSRIVGADKQSWCFVVINPNSNELRYYSVGRVECGWVQEKELIGHKHANKKFLE